MSEMLELANRIRDIAYSGVNNFDDFSSYKLDLIQDCAKLLQASLAAPSPHPRGEPVGYVSAATISALGQPEGSGPVVACAAFDTIIPLYAAPPPAGADAVQLQARPAEGGDWIDIYPSQLEWMAKEGHSVRAIEAPAPHPQEKPTGDQT